MKNNMNLISVDKIDLKYRDDIALRIYCFINNDFEPYRAFVQNNPHVKRGKVQAEIDKVRSCYKHIKKGGTIPPIKVLLKDGRMYPLDGAKRLSASYALNKDIPIQIQPNTEEYRLSKPFNINCDKFRDVPVYIKKALQLRKEIIDKVTDKEPDRKKLCCHSIPELGIIGEIDCATTSKLLGNLSGKKVLDIGCKMGMMSIECSRQGAIVDGFEFDKEYFEIANSVKNFFNVNSVNFYHITSLDLTSFVGQYDIILPQNIL
jgi:hypothetical protein